jgi:hypothetical protein
VTPSTVRRAWALLSTLTLLALPLAAAAAATHFDEDYDKKPWSEMEVQLPAFPEKEDLIGFTVTLRASMSYFIDGKSISAGSDGVLRYTLVIVSAAGAQNISYEGMRCETAERRLYAFGRSDKTWSKARSNEWIPIHGAVTDPRVELYVNYFCKVGATTIMNADDARRALRERGRPAAEQ